LLFVPDLYLKTNLFPDLARGLGQVFRRREGTGFIDHVAGFVDGFRNNRIAIQVMAILLVLGTESDEVHIDLAQRRLLLLVFIKAVGTEDRSFDRLTNKWNGIGCVQEN